MIRYFYDLLKSIFLEIIFLLFISLSLVSAPLKNVPLTLKQPDGTILNVFASGDEFYNWVHDKDNYTIIIDRATGNYVYAKIQNDDLIPSEYVVGKVNPNLVGLEKGVNYTARKIQGFREQFYKQNGEAILSKTSAATTGQLNNLVIFIRFADESEFTDNISRYDSLFNAPENSLNNYFNEVSYNQIDITTTFFPITTSTVLSYQDKLPRSYYQPFDSTKNPNGYKTTGTDKKLREHTLLVNTVNYVRGQIPATLNIDRNNDGLVDNVCFIIIGGNDAWNTLLWPHRWTLYSQAVLINGKKVYDYNLQIQKMVGVGVFSHEMFHTLGSPDLYHYASDSRYSPCGAWDIMDGGNSHMSAYMKFKYGRWIPSIETIDKSGTYVLNPLTSPTGNSYKIKSSKSDSEYFIVEYRKQTGVYESKLPGSGLLIYRINTKHIGNADGPPDEVYLYRPDGSLLSNGKPNEAMFSRSVNRYAMNDFTNPSDFLTAGEPGGLDISDIGNAGSTISFSVIISDPTIPVSVKNFYISQAEYSLEQNYPDPFNPSTIIGYILSAECNVNLSVYDALGRKVKTLVNQRQSPGRYSVIFDATGFSSGIYFYHLQAGSFNGIKKMLLVR
jgi:M6 family metalloprotease-like protein